MKKITGVVVSGCNDFQTRIANNSKVFSRVIGEDLYPGTINVKVDDQIPIKEDLRILGSEIGEDGQDLIIEYCRINQHRAYRIRPYCLLNGRGGHGDDTLEIACATRIPNVDIGQEVEVELFRE